MSVYLVIGYCICCNTVNDLAAALQAANREVSQALPVLFKSLRVRNSIFIS